jgi:hypothetical protein
MEGRKVVVGNFRRLKSQEVVRMAKSDRQNTELQRILKDWIPTGGTGLIQGRKGIREGTT